VPPPERGVPRAHIDHLDLVVSGLDRSLAFLHVFHCVASRGFGIYTVHKPRFDG
jgi:hypothetical protein